jgi:hypothetical protein
MSLLLDRLYHLHWVTPEAARSAQPYLGFYAAFLAPHGFKAVINLRGENARYRWWRGEKRVTEKLGQHPLTGKPCPVVRGLRSGWQAHPS